MGSKHLFVSALLLVLAMAACRQRLGGLGNTSVIGEGFVAQKAMVVCANAISAEIGAEIMRNGGNAVDAAVAVQFALAVTYPIAGNLGGGGFMVWRSAGGETATLDFRETAPALAQRDMYLDSLKNVVPRLSLDGHLAAGVPGTVAGAVEMHRKFGSMPFADLLQPAIRLARDGFALVSEKQASALNKYQADFGRLNTRPSPLLKPGGWQMGDSLRQPDLARTLQTVAELGRAGFYEGAVADSIVAEMERGGGIISHDDLKNYRAVWRKPIVGDYKQYRIVSMPPPSSGGIALMQLLKITESEPVRRWGRNSVETVHFMAEAERRVYADRATHLGDPDYYDVPVSGLLDGQYLRSRMADFKPGEATPSAAVRAGEPPVGESEETTHLSIVDPSGNAVAITTTLNAAYGSKLTAGGTGVLLNNEMDDFSAKPGAPNLYGLVGNEANAIAPGKRMLSSMTPTIVEKEGGLFMVVGTPGGSTIITSVYQSVLNVVEHGMSMQQAVGAGRVHHQWKPDSIFVEPDFDAYLVRQLESMGHAVVERSPIGRVDAILVREGGGLEAGADPRGDDAAAGF